VEESVLAILNHIVAFMEKNGASRNTVFFNIDEIMAHEMFESTGKQ